MPAYLCPLQQAGQLLFQFPQSLVVASVRWMSRSGVMGPVVPQDCIDARCF